MTRLTSTERYMIIAVTIVTVIILGIMFLMGISTNNDVPAVSQKEREAFEQQMNSKDSTTTHRKKKSSSEKKSHKSEKSVYPLGKKMKQNETK